MCGESLTEFPSEFFSLSQQGFPKWTLALRRKFSSKKTFHEKNIYFYRFWTLTELHLRVQRKVLFRNTVLDFLLSFHDFEPNSFGFNENPPNFFPKLPSMSPLELLREYFVLDKPNTCLTFSNSGQKRSVVCLGFFNRTLRIPFHVTKRTSRVKSVFEKKISSIFLDSDKKTCGFCQNFFASFKKTASVCPLDCFAGKEMFYEKDVLFLGF